MTISFFAAARSGGVSALKKFIKAGFPIDDRNGQSYTALMITAYQGQSEAVPHPVYETSGVILP